MKTNIKIFAEKLKINLAYIGMVLATSVFYLTLIAFPVMFLTGEFNFNGVLSNIVGGLIGVFLTLLYIVLIGGLNKKRKKDIDLIPNK